MRVLVCPPSVARVDRGRLFIVTPSQIRYLLELASEMKRHPSAHTGAPKGQTLAMIFEKPSLRTRV